MENLTDVKREIEERDIKYSTEFCEIANDIVHKCNEYRERLTEALEQYECATANEKKKAFKTVEKVFIETKVYVQSVKMPNSNFYLDNTSGKKYNNRVKRANKLMYDTLTALQKDIWNLGFELERVDKNLDKKFFKEREKLEQESCDAQFEK